MKGNSSRMKKLWGDVTAEMMTEEETGPEENYIRHRQTWRSSSFNKLIDKIDQKKNSKSLARQRQIGEEVARSPPAAAKAWMISTSADDLDIADHDETTNDEQASDNSE